MLCFILLKEIQIMRDSLTSKRGDVVKCEQFIVIGCSVSGSRVARQRGRFRGRRLPLKGER